MCQPPPISRLERHIRPDKPAFFCVLLFWTAFAAALPLCLRPFGDSELSLLSWPLQWSYQAQLSPKLILLECRFLLLSAMAVFLGLVRYGCSQKSVCLTIPAVDMCLHITTRSPENPKNGFAYVFINSCVMNSIRV